MKLQLKGITKGAITLHIAPGKNSIYVSIKVKKLQHDEQIPASLLHRINACTTLPELMELLFTTTEKTETIIQAFDQKIEALEKAGQTSRTYTFDPVNNGKITPNPAA